MTPKDWDKIEKLLGPMADQKTVEAVKALVEGIETSLKGSLTANVIKKVQRGLAKTNDSGYINVPISSVNLEKTFARISNVLANTNDDTASHGTTNSIGTDGYLINSTTLHIIVGGFIKDKYVAWEVIEFY